MELDGENLPKGTPMIIIYLSNYIAVRERGHQEWNTLLQWVHHECNGVVQRYSVAAKPEYIKRISDESNKICLEQGKKTISGEFFY